MSGSDILLSVRDIWKTYAVPHGGQSLPVLRGLDFCLERGEMAGLVGESGSGKSTLARVLLPFPPGAAAGSGQAAGARGTFFFAGRSSAA